MQRAADASLRREPTQRERRLCQEQEATIRQQESEIHHLRAELDKLRQTVRNFNADSADLGPLNVFSAKPSKSPIPKQNLDSRPGLFLAGQRCRREEVAHGPVGQRQVK